MVHGTWYLHGTTTMYILCSMNGVVYLGSTTISVGPQADHCDQRAGNLPRPALRNVVRIVNETRFLISR